ncbi:hypothetical protein [Mycolicibacterium frederiksbergense]|nr:hypothetical protein [Mycolicibacterium frederiksbergense]
MRTRHISLWIEARPETVYSYAAEPGNLAADLETLRSLLEG